MTISVIIQISPMGKQRPRFNGKHAYMSNAYTTWKQSVCLLLNASGKTPHPPLSGRLSIRTALYTKTGNMRSDADNAHAAILDCLQDAGWIHNDRQVKEGSYALYKSRTNCDFITILIDELRGESLTKGEK